MAISAYLCDTMTGRLQAPIDLPAINWSVSVSDSSLSTTRDKGVGDTEVSGLQVPWDNVPGSTWEEKRRAIAPMRSSIAVFWRDDRTSPDSLGTPFLCGAIGVRTDTVADTSFQLLSPLSMLANRYAVREGKYAAGKDHTSPDTIRLDGLSYRAIACAIGELCTNVKPNGSLPIDWPYLGEKGSRAREYGAWNIANCSGRDILEKLTNIQNGPDMQFRPYLAGDGLSVRYRFTAGSDADVYLGQDSLHHLAYHPDGGSLQDVTVDHLGPVQRVYASGAGQDLAKLTAFAQDRAALTAPDPWPLTEMTYADADTDNPDVLQQHANATLAANGTPLIQLHGLVHVNRTDSLGNYTLPLGSFWPGELFEVSVDDHPALPAGLYRTRLMQMSGDLTDAVKLTFDVQADPEP